MRTAKAFLGRLRSKLIPVQTPPKTILNYTQYLVANQPGKRALLSYLPVPVYMEQRGQTTYQFSNHGIARSWPRVLNKLGYTVDIISWDDTEFAPSSQYDLVIFHGGKNFQNLKSALKPRTQAIHFLAGSYWKYNNQAESKRFADLKKRRSIDLEPDRYIEANEDDVSAVCLANIVIGGKEIIKTYPKSPPTHAIPIGAYPGVTIAQNKDYSASQSNFLYFAGGGSVHKGLDLLLEVFALRPDLQLHIMATVESDFEAAFARELGLPNIHNHGHVAMRSEVFTNVSDICAWVIMPSCSEGQPGSVVEGMLHGLIPIVTKQCHIDVRAHGIVLADAKIPTIARAVDMATNMPSKTLTKWSIASHQRAITEHSPELFEERLTNAIKTSLKSQVSTGSVT